MGQHNFFHVSTLNKISGQRYHGTINFTNLGLALKSEEDENKGEFSILRTVEHSILREDQ